MKRVQIAGIVTILVVGLGSAGVFVIIDPLNVFNNDSFENPLNQPNGLNNTQTFGGYNFTSFDWQYSSPWEQGFGISTFSDLEIFVPDGTKSIIVIRNGKIVYEKYYSGSNNTQHHLFSVTKSIMSMLIGIAIDQGIIHSINDKLLDFFPNKTFKNVDGRKERMTLYHLLTMTHGIDWEELVYPYGDGRNSFSQMWSYSDWTSYFLNLPMIHEPGTQFEYSTAAAHTLSAIIEKVTGMKTNKFAEKNLFNPLGIKTSDTTWLTDGSGTFEGGRGLHLIMTDMAKFGQLYLNNGSWNGVQIVSKEWVANSTTNHSPSASDTYGYQWRIHYNGYSALGYQAQRIYNIPEHNLSFIMTASLDNVYAANFLVNNIVIPGIIN